MLLKWVAYGFKVYFTNAWCWLDFLIVDVSSAPAPKPDPGAILVAKHLRKPQSKGWAAAPQGLAVHPDPRWAHPHRDWLPGPPTQPPRKRNRLRGPPVSWEKGELWGQEGK